MNRQMNHLHEETMERMDDALVAQRRGDDQAARAAFRQAFHLERAAAELLLTLPDPPEPSRSVFLRSAASLARDAYERVETLRLIQLGLSGEPPGETCDAQLTCPAAASASSVPQPHRVSSRPADRFPRPKTIPTCQSSSMLGLASRLY